MNISKILIVILIIGLAGYSVMSQVQVSQLKNELAIKEEKLSHAISTAEEMQSNARNQAESASNSIEKLQAQLEACISHK